MVLILGHKVEVFEGDHIFELLAGKDGAYVGIDRCSTLYFTFVIK